MKKEDLKIVFLGTPDFAVESLKLLIENQFNVVGVVTMPDKPAGRGHQMFESPVKKFAVEKGLKVMQPEKLKDPNFLAELKSLNADLFIVIAFRMLPEVVWQMPKLGTFNLHASLLPDYRGAAPINWAVINGETKTGVTTFFLKHEIDTGDIIQQQEISILSSDNVGDVHDKLMILGAQMTLDTVNAILKGNLEVVPQSELVNKERIPHPAPKIFKETCRIDWTRKGVDIHNLVRGLSPYPCAWTEILDSSNPERPPLYTLKIIETKLIPNQFNLKPGEISTSAGFVIGTGDSRAIELLKLQPSGKKTMKADDFLRGARLPKSSKLI